MSFEKGKVKTGGRAPGVQNQATRDIRAIAQGLIQDPSYQLSLKARLLRGSSPQLEVLFHYYAYGKPKTEISVEDKTLNVIIDRCCHHDQRQKLPLVIEHPPDDKQGTSDT